MSEGFELSVERHIAASPAAVWRAMTDDITKWWCPRPWTTTVVALDWRAGGAFHLIMRGPAGEADCQSEESVGGILLEVAPESRFVFTDAISADWTPRKPFLVGIFELTPDGDGTHYRASARHWDEATMEQHKAMGFDEGWGAVADQLAALAEA